MTAEELKDAIVRSLIYNRLTYEGRLLYEEKRGLSDGYPAHHHPSISAAKSPRPGLIAAGSLEYSLALVGNLRPSRFQSARPAA
jgi:hypothetical protein